MNKKREKQDSVFLATVFSDIKSFKILQKLVEKRL